MSDSQIEEIKSRLDIIEVISQYIKLRKTGANYNAICPFHSEKSGSFFVSPARQTWKCFGCGKGGDIFTFIEEIESIEFGDALRILAAKAGIELKRQTRESKEAKTERQRYYEVCELAAKFFVKQLQANTIGREAEKYLLGRGLTRESVSSWRLGYSPDSWQGLHDFLASEGYVDAEIVGAGLALASASGRVYDRFRGRIMFPIFDFNSQVVGFGGRIFEDKNNPVKSISTENYGQIKEAKYLNTINTLLYDKSRLLYGFDRAKVAVRRLDACILVEGYTDVIMSVQAGVDNVAASSGTALTPQHLQLLKRFTGNIILGYDMDLAGDTANRRGIEMAQGMGFNVSVARPPFEGMDPADVIARDPQAWRMAAGKPMAIMEFYFNRAFAGRNAAAPEGKREIAGLLLPHIKQIANTIEQSYWLQKLSLELGVREEDLREEIKKVKLNEYAANSGDNKPVVLKTSRRDRLEERVLILIIKFPEAAAMLDDKVLTFFSENGRQIIKAVRDENEGQEGIKEDYNSLALKAESEVIDKKDALNEIECHLYGDNGIKDTQLKEEYRRLVQEVRQAEDRHNQPEINKLREEINQMCKAIAELKLRNPEKINKI